jgi:hypothetical protein
LVAWFGWSRAESGNDDVKQTLHVSSRWEPNNRCWHLSDVTNLLAKSVIEGKADFPVARQDFSI